MSHGTMDLAPLLSVSRAVEWFLLLLIRGLLLAIPMIFAISPICCVDLPIVLLLLRGPLATLFKELCSGLVGLDAHVSNCEQIAYCLGLLHYNLLNSLDVTHSIMKSIDDLDVLDIRDSVPSVAETFHIFPETLIMLLLDGLQGLSSRWMPIYTLKVFDEHGT
jgi:hypothetical protein